MIFSKVIFDFFFFFLNTSAKFISYLICFMLCIGENMYIDIEAVKETEKVACLKNDEGQKKRG